jgi:hypothetical protein
MYAFLLISGAVIAVAGVLTAAAGLPILGHDFDPSVITPGAVFVVGGLILVAWGSSLRLARRMLSRIEQVLPTQPLPRIAMPEEAAGAASAVAAVPASAPPPPPPRVSLPPAPEIRLQPTPATAAATLPEDAALERLREQFPILGRVETATVVEKNDISLPPKPPAPIEEDVAEPDNVVALGRGQANGAAPARIEPRLDPRARPTPGVERSRKFDAYWPKKQRAVPGASPAPAVQPATSAVPPPPPSLLPVEPALPAEPTQFQFREPVPEPHSEARANGSAQVSVLKSGVVDGMAYTLYSDGSIEAQLPQGMLRFGSIAELRNHIEQSA